MVRRTVVESLVGETPVEVLDRAGKAQTGLIGCSRKIPVPSHEDDFLVAELKRGGEMNCVIATKSKIFGMLAGATSEGRIDAYGDQVFLQLLERRQRPFVRGLPQAALASCGRQSRASLRVGEDAGRCRMTAVPELGGQLGAILDDDELDQRRGVEVEDQARCSETRSDTEPLLLTSALRGDRDALGIRTNPRRSSSSSGRSASSPLRRAIRRPRRVTTISPPPSTRSKYSLRRSWSSRTPTSPWG